MPLALRFEVFEKVGGFDAEHFRSHCSDVDLSWRIRLEGLQVLHTPDSVVFLDERIDRNGVVRSREVAVRSSVLGGLNLAHKYGRTDVEQELLQRITAHGSDAEKKGAMDFRTNASSERTPKPIQRGSDVADFDQGEYGEQRF